MNFAIILVFVIAYALVAFEESTKLNKAIPALLSATIIWVLYAVNSDSKVVHHDLLEHIGELEN